MLWSGKTNLTGTVLADAATSPTGTTECRIVIIGIGEGLAAFALPHHRAYGSVHGGSCSLA